MSTNDHWESLARHSPLGILLDLDGTLLPFADRPEDARPGQAHLALLRDLAHAPGVSLAIVSGRTRESLESLFVEVPGVWLVAEHGGWLRERFDCIELHPEPKFTYRDKIQPLFLSPFEKTLFLDTDTELIGRVDDLFDLLESRYGAGAS